MYVKLVRVGEAESVYECDRYFIRPTNEAGFFDITLESDREWGYVYLGAIDRTKTSIYVMNNDGKTIEHYAPVVAQAA
jgi:hypothetical protein